MNYTIDTKGYKQNYTVTFTNDKGYVGNLDFNGDAMKFEGDVDESGKIFLDFVARSFANRLKEERSKALDEAIELCKSWDFNCQSLIKRIEELK